jgi:hypothetical protein
MTEVSYTKLFSSITDSTIWSESAETRIVWITMLAMCDKNGWVYASIPGLAHRAHVTIEETEEALNKFLSPDKYSRTPDHEGRRIEVIDGGWALLNHPKYKAIRSADERREYQRKWIAEKRKAEKKLLNVDSFVDNVEISLSKSTHTDTDTDIKHNIWDSELINPEAWNDFLQHRKEMGKPFTDLAKTKVANKLKDYSYLEQQEAVNTSIESRWAGVFPKKTNGTNNETHKRTSKPENSLERFSRFINTEIANE